jgi:hypothetical protein
MEDLIKMVTVRHRVINEGNDERYRQFIHEVAFKVRDLEQQYKKLAENFQRSLMIYFSPLLKSILELMSWLHFVILVQAYPQFQILYLIS